MKVVEMKRLNTSEQIIEELKGKAFLAIKIDRNADGSHDYHWFISETLPDEVIVMACELLKKDILGKVIE